MEVLDAARGRVSSEWFSRPADERDLSLSELFVAVRGRTDRSRTRTVESAAVRVDASRNDAERLTLRLPGAEAPTAPTHWSFGQPASLVGAPATYLRQLPAPLAGINLQYGLASHCAAQVKTLEIDYGRIFDRELVAAVQRIAALRVTASVAVDAELAVARARLEQTSLLQFCSLPGEGDSAEQRKAGTGPALRIKESA